VVLHARSADRAATIAELASRAAGIALGDFAGPALGVPAHQISAKYRQRPATPLKARAEPIKP
jgi:hypothetical protein